MNEHDFNLDDILAEFHREEAAPAPASETPEPRRRRMPEAEPQTLPVRDEPARPAPEAKPLPARKGSARPAAEPKPFTFAARARVAGVPAFPAGAALKVSAVKAKNRGGASGDGKTKVARVEKDAVRIEIPAASAGAARSYEFEVVAESARLK